MILEIAPTGMDALGTAMAGILTVDKFFANLTILVPVIGGLLIFAFTYRIVKKMIGGAQKGKARI